MQIIGGEVTDIYLINKVVCLSTIVVNTGPPKGVYIHLLALYCTNKGDYRKNQCS